MACVKTAISIEESLFRQAEQVAGKLNISRSQLFARALKDFLSRYTAEEIRERMNKVYAGPPDEEAPDS